MKVGDLVEVICGINYEERRIGIVVDFRKWIDIREVRVQLFDGSIRSYSPLLVRKLKPDKKCP